MGRPRSIDRDKLLDMAEKIVGKDGPAALTIDAVARAAGITKGGGAVLLRNKGSVDRGAVKAMVC